MILINDPVRHGYHKRKQALQRKRGVVGSMPQYTFVLRGKRTEGVILYREVIALPTGVSRGGRVVIYHYLQDCCTRTQMDAYEVGPVCAVTEDRPVSCPFVTAPDHTEKLQHAGQDLTAERILAEEDK